MGLGPLIDIDLLVSVSSDIGGLVINAKGEKRYQKSDDCLGATKSCVGLYPPSVIAICIYLDRLPERSPALLAE